MFLTRRLSRHPRPRARGGHRPRVCRGFSLVEVLVVSIVIIVGLAGMGTLQVVGLRAVQSAFERSQATSLVNEMADRLRANRGTPTGPLSALGGAYDNASLCLQGARHPRDGRACTLDEVTDFSNTNVATQDLLAWWQNLRTANLRHWYAGIRRNGRVLRIAVQWDDVRAAPDLAESEASRASCLGDAMPAQLQEVCVSTQL